MRRDSWRSVPMMCKPPVSMTLLWRSVQSWSSAAIISSVGASNRMRSADRLPPSTMSVPRPAMLVAIVTVPSLVRLQESRQELRGLDRSRADEHGLAALVAVLDVLDDRAELVIRGEIDEIRRVVTDHRLVRRDHDDLETVDLL